MNSNCLSTLILITLLAGFSLTDCRQGKCTLCMTTGPGQNTCQSCYESKLNNGVCEGDSTTIANCAVSTMVTSSSDGTYFACQLCAPEFHLKKDGTTTSCYEDSEKNTENCIREQATVGSGGNISYQCKLCANGFTLGSLGGSCEAGTEVPNCYGMGSSAGKCEVCLPKYFANSAGECVLRETEEQKSCFSGEKAGFENDVILCQQCHFAGGRYAVSMSSFGIGQVCRSLISSILWVSLIILGLMFEDSNH